METLLNFTLSIIASLVATLLLLLTATWRSKTVRRVLTAAAASLLRIDIKYVFTNGKEAENEIKEALRKAKYVRIFTGRGNEFQRDLYTPMLHITGQGKPVVQILLPDPTSKANGTDWIDQREIEIAIFDKAFGKGTLRRQIENNLLFLLPHIEPERFEVRKYNAPHIGRIILTDNFLFLQPYKDTLHGRYNPVIQFGRGDMYDMFSRFFDIMWLDCKSNALRT